MAKTKELKKSPFMGPQATRHVRFESRLPSLTPPPSQRVTSRPQSPEQETRRLSERRLAKPLRCAVCSHAAVSLCRFRGSADSSRAPHAYSMGSLKVRSHCTCKTSCSGHESAFSVTVICTHTHTHTHTHSHSDGLPALALSGRRHSPHAPHTKRLAACVLLARLRPTR